MVEVAAPEILTRHEYALKASRELIERSQGTKSDIQAMKDLTKSINEREQEVVGKLSNITEALGKITTKTMVEEMRKSTSELVQEHHKVLTGVYSKLASTMAGIGLGDIKLGDVQRMVGALNKFVDVSIDIGKGSELSVEALKEIQQASAQTGELLAGVEEVRAPPRKVGGVTLGEQQVTLLTDVEKNTQATVEQLKGGFKEYDETEKDKEKKEDRREKEQRQVGGLGMGLLGALGVSKVFLTGVVGAAAFEFGKAMGKLIDKRFGWLSEAADFWVDPIGWIAQQREARERARRARRAQREAAEEEFEVGVEALEKRAPPRAPMGVESLEEQTTMALRGLSGKMTAEQRVNLLRSLEGLSSGEKLSRVRQYKWGLEKGIKEASWLPTLRGGIPRVEMIDPGSRTRERLHHQLMRETQLERRRKLVEEREQRGETEEGPFGPQLEREQEAQGMIRGLYEPLPIPKKLLDTLIQQNVILGSLDKSMKGPGPEVVTSPGMSMRDPSTAGNEERYLHGLTERGF